MLAGTPLIDFKSEAGDYGAGDSNSFGIANSELHRDRRRCSFCELRAAVGRNRRQDLVTRTVGAKSQPERTSYGFHPGVHKADGVVG